MKTILILYTARITGIISRSLLSIVAGATLVPHELEKYNYILALIQIFAYIISIEFYQVVHRSYLTDAVKKIKIHAHIFLYAINLLIIILLTIAYSFKVIQEEVFIAVVAAYAYNIFIELYRYSGVLKKPVVGEIGYAARGLLSLLPILYLLNQNQTPSIQIILYCIIIDLAIGLMLGVVLYKSFTIDVIKLNYLKIIVRKFINLILCNINALLLMASTAILSRLLLNFDKIVGYISTSIELSTSYYFSSVLAISYFGMVESVANNKYAPMLLSKEISSENFLRKQFNLILLFGCVAILISFFLDYTLLIDRFQSNIFLFFLLASALNMISNAASIIIYARKKDEFNFASIFITLIFCGLVLGYFLFYNSWSVGKLDLKMCIAYTSAMAFLLFIKLLFLMRVNSK